MRPLYRPGIAPGFLMGQIASFLGAGFFRRNGWWLFSRLHRIIH